MRFCSIASGSGGNCVYVGSENTHLLVDVGISGKKVDAGLKELELEVKDIQGFLITHEHIDHVRGLGVLARRYEIPIYATEGSFERIKQMSILGNINESLFHVIQADKSFQIGDVKIRPFRLPHDAAEPVAYRLECDNKTLAIATDMGFYDEYIIQYLKNLDVVLLEANHDTRMLQTGPYPYALKKRIMSKYGHLSNESSGQLLCRILHDNLKKIYLGHLSKENNYPELAYEAVKLEIQMSEIAYQPSDFDIEVASQNMNSGIYTF